MTTIQINVTVNLRETYEDSTLTEMAENIANYTRALFPEISLRHHESPVVVKITQDRGENIKP